MVWFHILGVVSTVALGIGFVTAFASVTLSWIIFRHQAQEQAEITSAIAHERQRLQEVRSATESIWARMQPRFLAVGPFLEALKRHPTGTAMILYQPQDQEAYNFAFSLWPPLGHAGWIVSQPEPFRARAEPPFDRMPAGFAAGAQLNRGVTLVANVIGQESKNKAYLALQALQVHIWGRGMAWLDMGTQESLLQAANFIEAVESRQGLKIACVEEVAYRMGYIDAAQVVQLAQSLRQTGYGQYLLQLVQ